MLRAPGVPRLREVPRGTTIRFVLLIVLLLVTSGNIATLFIPNPSAAGLSWGCLLAAGGDPDQDPVPAAVLIGDQHTLYAQCLSRFEAPLPWWISAVWPVVVVLAAVALFFVLGVWKSRSGKTVRLEEIGDGGALRRRVDMLAVRAGVHSARFVVDPTALTATAKVFGRTGRPTVCLHGGLLVGGNGQSAGERDRRFVAVLMHEFAHIRNRDVTIAYLTVALWRCFLVAVVLPYVLIGVYVLTVGRGTWVVDSTFWWKDLARTAFMVVLVYLSRADVLRCRELCADITAVRWGADPRGWVFDVRAPRGGRAGRLAAAAREVWRTHPNWEIRRRTLHDHTEVHDSSPLLFFLTGAVAGLINGSVRSLLDTSGFDGSWAAAAPELVEAGLITGVAGIALYRTVSSSVAAARSGPSGVLPSGVRLGLSLGAGLTVSVLLLGQLGVGLTPAWYPLALPSIPLATVAVTCWIVQCTAMWTAGRNAARIAPMTAVLTPAWLALAAWLVWWDSTGFAFGQGVLSPAVLRGYLLDGPAPIAGHDTEISALWIVALAVSLTYVLPGSLAVAALSAAPILTRASRRGGDPEAGRLRSRLVLRAAGAGGLAASVGVVAVRVYLHSWQPSSIDGRVGVYAWIYLEWLLAVFAVAAAVAASIVSVAEARFGLVLSMVAAELAIVIGMVIVAVLASADGCLGPLNTLGDRCGVHTGLVAPMIHLLPAIMMSGVVIAAVCTGIVAVGRGMLVRSRILTRHADTAPRPHRSVAPQRNTPIARRTVLTMVATVVALAVVSQIFQITSAGQQSGETSVAAAAQPITGDSTAPVSPRIRTAQVSAWLAVGGDDLQRRSKAYRIDQAALGDQLDTASIRTLPVTVRALCTEQGKLAADAAAFFRIPDPRIQAIWERFIVEARTGSAECLAALRFYPEPDSSDPADDITQVCHEVEVMQALHTVFDAADLLQETDTRIRSEVPAATY